MFRAVTLSKSSFWVDAWFAYLWILVVHSTIVSQIHWLAPPYRTQAESPFPWELHRCTRCRLHDKQIFASHRGRPSKQHTLLHDSWIAARNMFRCTLYWKWLLEPFESNGAGDQQRRVASKVWNWSIRCDCARHSRYAIVGWERNGSSSVDYWDTSKSAFRWTSSWSKIKQRNVY